MAYFLIPVYNYPLLLHISSFLYVYYYPLLWHISSFLYIIIHCCGIFPHFCILLSTVVAYFLIPVYNYPLLWHISSFLYIIIHCCGIFPHCCILLSSVVAQERGNMPQQWIIIYRNEKICHNSG